jgi:hypothetical protein
MADKRKVKNPDPKKPGDKVTRNLVIGMIAFVLMAGFGAAFAKNNSNSHVALPSSVSKANGYGITFNCRNFEAVNNSYIDKLVRAGKIQAVYHPMHFLASDSLLTAAAAACAADQGKYLDFHTALYVNQPSTKQSAENLPYWTNAQLILLGNSIGITAKTFDSCINGGKYVNWTSRINEDAAKKNINATPTVIVNGKTLSLATDYSAKAFTKVLTDLGVK